MPFLMAPLLVSPALAEQAYSQGQLATQSGHRLESEIRGGLEDAGLELIKSSQWNEARLYKEPDLTAVITNAPYQTVFGHRARIEFLILHNGRQILVETKRQNVAGSVDEKLAYVYLNAVKNIPDRDYILVMDGDGWKPEAKRWILDKATQTPGFYVLSPTDFFAWIRGEIISSY